MLSNVRKTILALKATCRTPGKIRAISYGLKMPYKGPNYPNFKANILHCLLGSLECSCNQAFWSRMWKAPHPAQTIGPRFKVWRLRQRTICEWNPHSSVRWPGEEYKTSEARYGASNKQKVLLLLQTFMACLHTSLSVYVDPNTYGFQKLLMHARGCVLHQ